MKVKFFDKSNQSRTLSVAHQNPILSPINIVDSFLYSVIEILVFTFFFFLTHTSKLFLCPHLFVFSSTLSYAGTTLHFFRCSWKAKCGPHCIHRRYTNGFSSWSTWGCSFAVHWYLSSTRRRNETCNLVLHPLAS